MRGQWLATELVLAIGADDHHALPRLGNPAERLVDRERRFRKRRLARDERSIGLLDLGGLPRSPEALVSIGRAREGEEPAGSCVEAVKKPRFKRFAHGLAHTRELRAFFQSH